MDDYSHTLQHISEKKLRVGPQKAGVLKFILKSAILILVQYGAQKGQSLGPLELPL